MALPIESGSSLDQVMTQSNVNEASYDSSKNLFEYYKDYDLSFLKGYAIIIPKQELINSPDDIIMVLDSLLTPEFDKCNGGFEQRLETLFKVKSKWTF